MPDNSKEQLIHLILAIELQEWGFADGTRCYRKKDIDVILSQFKQVNHLVVPDIEYKDLPEGRYEKMQNQLTKTQQKLDIAVEALKFYAEPTNYESICPDNAQDRLMRAFGLIKPGDTPEVKKDNGQIAKTALTSIRSK